MSFYLKLSTTNTLDLLSYVYLVLTDTVQLGRVKLPRGRMLIFIFIFFQRDQRLEIDRSIDRCVPAGWLNALKFGGGVMLGASLGGHAVRMAMM